MPINLNSRTYEMIYRVGKKKHRNDMVLNLDFCREYMWVTIALLLKKNELSIDNL